MKTFNEWLFESGMNRDMTQPMVIDLEAGKVKVYADPSAENWKGEAARTQAYKKMHALLKNAVEKKNKDEVQKILQDLRDLPLFGQDTSNVWKEGHIDGVQNQHGDQTRRLWAARYALHKIELFLKWVEDNL